MHTFETASVSVPEPYFQCLVPVCQEILFSSGSEGCALSAVHNCPPAIRASAVWWSDVSSRRFSLDKERGAPLEELS